MLKVTHTETYGWEASIRGMRNALESWDKSDSVFTMGDTFIGENDLSLMKRLVKAGSDHSKFMRMITVTCDITAPLYWWTEADTYKVGTVRNSCSKMHKLLARPFEMSDFSFDKLPGYKNEIKQFRPILDENMVANEAWRRFDEHYDISNYGRIKHKFKTHYRMISGSLHEDGYIFVTLHGKQYPLHRLVAKLWHPKSYREDLVVNHKDGNKQNNFASNLEWVTQKENVEHSHALGLQPLKAKGYTGKFSAEERNTIKRLWDEGSLSKRQIAEKYGVSHTCINDIINDKYKYAESVDLYKELAKPWVDALNELRDSYLNCEDEEAKKQIWYSIIQLLPESYNQRATLQLNYAVLRNIYHARKSHKLKEWHTLCEWIEGLPYSELITEAD